jgi:hypothetical protein
MESVMKDELADFGERLMKSPDPKFWAESFLKINHNIKINKNSKNDLEIMRIWFTKAFKSAVEMAEIKEKNGN